MVPCSSRLGATGILRPECATPANLGPLSSRRSTHPSFCNRRLLRPGCFARQRGSNGDCAAPYVPADTSHGCVHEDDARWVGGPLTSIAVLSAPNEGSFSTSGHRAPATSIIGQMKRYPELPALPTPITPGWGTRSFRSKPWTSRTPGYPPWRPRGGAATRRMDLWLEASWPSHRQWAALELPPPLPTV